MASTLNSIVGITTHGGIGGICELCFPGSVSILGCREVIWDGLQSHRSRLVRDFVAEADGRLQLEFLPTYAPELNPAEYIWGHWKQHELPNFCPKNLRQLSQHARKALRRMRRRPSLITAFWKQARLFQRHYIMRAE